MSFPDIAISVRQPWAWAIVHAGKDIENRGIKAVSYGLGRPGRRAVHAAKGLTREEYDEAAEFFATLGIVCPPAADLLRGGIIGSVDVVDVVSESASRWLFGPRGLVLANAAPCEFVPSVGELGLFRWRPADPSIVPAPARWMMPPSSRPSPAAASIEPDLFG